MRKFFDFENPFYRPLWIRVTIVAVCMLWGLREFASGQSLWAVIFIGGGVYCAWNFFSIDYQDDVEE